MVTATKIFTFEAAHYLLNHPGACKFVHGHSYRLEVTFKKDETKVICDANPADMVMDFSEIKRVIQEIIIDRMDHRLINDVPEWQKLYLRPTAENMVEIFASWIMHYNRGFYADNLVSLRLWETATSYVTWTKE